MVKVELLEIEEGEEDEAGGAGKRETSEGAIGVCKRGDKATCSTTDDTIDDVKEDEEIKGLGFGDVGVLEGGNDDPLFEDWEIRECTY